MFDKLRQAHLHAHDWQQESLTFVPLRGTWFAQSEHSFDLEEEITKFLSGDKKVLLLLGDSGSGKSLYTQGLASKLWQDHKDDSPIPVWISLPSLKNPVNKVIEETFEKFGFNAEQITSLKQTHSFIFILDAFDEIHQLKNLWVSNHLDQWKAKIIITCRREYLYHVDNYKHFFTPFNGEKALYLEYDEIIIKPFSEEQIEKYIKQYIQHQQPEWKLEQYQKSIEEMLGLKNLIKTPFLLKLAMEALPKIPQDKEQKIMTQAKLYDVFIEQWFIRQEQKLKLAKKIKEDEDVKPEFWDYAKKLAQLMHQQKTSLVTYDSSQSSDLFGEAEDNSWQKFFNADNPRIELLRTACLVREVGSHQYAFVHNSLLEYFLTRDLYENLLFKPQEVKVIQETPKSPQLEVKKQQDYFNERLLVEEANTLQFLADRVDEDEGFKKTLFDRVYASRKNPQASIQASNALTILNRARVSFSGMNLSNVYAPEANLSYAMLSHTCFKSADLSKAILTGSYLESTDFVEANLENVYFGEYPSLEIKCDNYFCYSKDGQYLAVVSDQKHITLYLKKNEKYKKVTEMKHDSVQVNFTIDFSPDGKMMASGGCGIGGGDSTVYLWSISKQKLLIKLKGHGTDNDIGREVYCVAFSPDGKLLASGGGDKTIRLWDIIHEKQLAKIKLDGVPSSVAFSPDGKMLASRGRLWDVSSQKLLAELREYAGGHVFSRDGKILAGVDSETVYLWDPISQKLLAELKVNSPGVSVVAFSPNGTLLASAGGRDKTVRLWDVVKQQLLSQMSGSDEIKSVAFSPDGKTLVTGSSEKILRQWDIAINQQLPYEVKGHIDSVRCVVFSPDGKLLASGSHGYYGKVLIWDVINRRLLAELHTEAYNLKLAFSPDGKTLALGSNDNEKSKTTVCLWDMVNQRQLAGLKDHKGEVKKLAFSPDGKTLVSVGDSIYFWDPVSLQSRGEGKFKEKYISHIAFSPDGTLLAYNGNKGIVGLWDLTSQKYLALLKGHSDYILDIAFSPDGKLLATCSRRTVYLWSVPNQELLVKLKGGHSKQGAVITGEPCVISLAFSSDGKLLASGGNDKIVCLWDVTHYKLISKLSFHSHSVTCFAFSPNRNMFASGSVDRSIALWEKISVDYLQQERWMVTCRFENSHALSAKNAFFKGAKIYSQNLKLLKQRGANDDQWHNVDILDEEKRDNKTNGKEVEVKDKSISTSGNPSSFWSSSREQVPEPPPPTKDTEPKSFTF